MLCPAHAMPYIFFYYPSSSFSSLLPTGSSRALPIFIAVGGQSEQTRRMAQLSPFPVS